MCPVLGMGATPAGPLCVVERWELHLEGSMGHAVEDRQDLPLSVPPGHWAALGEWSLPAPARHSSAWVPPPTNRSQVHQEEQTKGSRRERSVKGSSYRRHRGPAVGGTHHGRLVPDGLQAVLHGPAVRRRLHVLAPHGRASGTFSQAQDRAGESCKRNQCEDAAHSHIPGPPHLLPQHQGPWHFAGH